MRRADRLFQIVQLIRGRSVVTAAEIARELEVSERTIYRDVRDLIACGVPIEGEAGVGYALPRGFDLPPLMFTEREIEALVLGARMVESWGGPELARQAHNVLSKVQHVLPDRLKDRLMDVGLYAPGFHVPEALTSHLEPLRRAVDEKLKVRFAYTTAEGKASERTVRPLGLYYWGKTWTALAWCELRDDFRSFRPDRMEELAVTDVCFEDEPGRDLQSFLALILRDHEGRDDGR